MKQMYNELIEAVAMGSCRETIREIAHAAFPLTPGEEGYFSDNCEYAVHACYGSLGSAVALLNRLQPCWEITRLEKGDDGWACSLSLKKEAHAPEMEYENVEANGAPSMSSAALVAILGLQRACS